MYCLPTLHGGALVANYPFDDSPDGKDVYNRTPDDKLFRHLASVYSDAHPMMHYGNGCIEAPYETFDNGITNGAQWYSVRGGMQDFNYLHSNDFEITIEMGCYKFPSENRLRSYWENHKVPLLRLVMEMFKGIKGFVKSSSGSYLSNATIRIHGIDHNVQSLSNGDYFRLLLPGTYHVTASLPGYARDTKKVVVNEGPAIVLNFTLTQLSNKELNRAYDKHIKANEADNDILKVLLKNVSTPSIQKGKVIFIGLSFLILTINF